MELVKVCAFALMGVLLALQFKGGKQEYGIYLGAALAVVVFSCTLSYMGQAKKQLMGLWQQLSGGQSYLTLLFKVVGITWISELVSGICKDSGYSAVASQVELFGKIAILFAGMPIFLALAETIAGFAGGEGVEPGNTEHYLEQLNLTELMEQLNRCFSSAFLADFSLEQLFSDILSGNGKEALQLLGRQIAGSVGQEFSGMRQILSVLLLLGILSVLVSCLMGSFENQQVAQIAHDMFFLLVLTVLLKVFSAVYRITSSTLETLKQFSHLTLPALCLSLGPAAGSVTAAGYYELALGLIFLIERFLSGFCLLLLPLWMLLVVLSGVWEEGRLSAMMELVEKSLSWILKFCLGTVTGLGVLQSMVAPALDAWKRTAAQKAIAAIPGLGDLAEGTAQVLLGSAVLVKNSLGMFVGILLAVLLVVPLLKIAAYGVVLKLAGAFVGLVADKRLTACMTKTADVVFSSLKLAGTGAACFWILAAIVSCLAGRL